MTDENRMDILEEKKPSAFRRVLTVLLVTVLLLGAGAYGAGYVLFRGPFVHAQAAFVQHVNNYPVGSAILSLFVTDQQQQELMAIDAGTGIAEGQQKTFSVYPNMG